MKKADEAGVIDYCPGHLTTIDTETKCYSIHHCPFCGKHLPGTEKAIKEILGRAKKVGIK